MDLAATAPLAQVLQDYEWQFGSNLRIEHVWNGFTILCLLEDAARRSVCLDVPDTGDQAHCFQEAVQARNLRMRQLGQPDALHYCNVCTRWWEPTGNNDTLCTCYSNLILY